MFYTLAALLGGIATIALFAWLRTLKGKRALLFQLPRDAAQTLLGMSAKLACSAHHISGFTAQRIRSDLRNYSPIFRLVTIHQDDEFTSANIGKLISTSARFDPLYGCTLRREHNFETQRGNPALPQSAAVNAGGKSEKAARHISPALQDLLQSQIQHDNDSGLDTRALVVFRGDAIIAEAYASGITEDTRLLGWSMTKSLLAMLFGRMETLGLAQASENNLFPEWSGDSRSEITLRHLLQMCDGLAFNETYRPGADATRMLFGQQPASRYALQRPLVNTPGAHFSYSSGSTNLLARWMHHRLGGTAATLAFWQHEFAAPLGMKNAIMEVDGDGVFIGSSYGYATAQDWGRLASLFLSGGKLNAGEAPLLDPAWLAHAVRPNGSDNDPRYGYQLWLNHRSNRLPPLHPRLPTDSFFMLGNREQKLMVAPSHDAVIVRLGWSASPYPVEDRFGEILQALPN